MLTRRVVPFRDARDMFVECTVEGNNRLCDLQTSMIDGRRNTEAGLVVLDAHARVVVVDRRVEYSSRKLSSALLRDPL